MFVSSIKHLKTGRRKGPNVNCNCMKHTKFILLLTLFFLSSCVYHIKIFNDGTSHVKIKDLLIDENGARINAKEYSQEYLVLFDKFQENGIIKNYSRDTTLSIITVDFDVLDIDSLGKFLVPYRDVDLKIDFKLTKNKLVITNTYIGLESEGEFGMYTDSKYSVIIEFEKEIKSLNSELDYIKLKGKKSIKIESNTNELSYGKGSKSIEIVFK